MLTPLVEEVRRTEPDYDPDGKPVELYWLEDRYVCPEHGETFCGAPVPTQTDQFCEECAEAVLTVLAKVAARGREPHEHRELSEQVDSLTGRPA